MILYPNSSTGNSLQSTISAATSGVDPNGLLIGPHHPITCQSTLTFDEEGELACEHSKAQKGEPRVQACLNHSLALLIVELATKL